MPVSSTSTRGLSYYQRPLVPLRQQLAIVRHCLGRRIRTGNPFFHIIPTSIGKVRRSRGREELTFQGWYAEVEPMPGEVEPITWYHATFTFASYELWGDDPYDLILPQEQREHERRYADEERWLAGLDDLGDDEDDIF